ncbi:MAG: exo-beta-N-acetylmuramidase NamZ domain-containing protein [Verrucomicrobiota bacterium]
MLVTTLPLSLLTGPVSAQVAVNPGFRPEKLEVISAEISGAVQRGEIPGGVVWLERDGKHWENVYGNRALAPAKESMSADTIFDAASLTKVMATTPSVMLLVQEGKVALDAPVSKYLPEFTGQGKEQITVLQLLTHVSGLMPDITTGFNWIGYEEGIRRVMTEPIRQAPEMAFVYSDINFVLLGEIVRRVSGEALNTFALNRIYKPLHMEDTQYLPDPAKMARIAPTEIKGTTVLRGVVHDPTARCMEGVAGHAGLFTTMADTAKYCRMLLNQGKGADGTVILKPETVAQMTAVHVLPGNEKRTLGFDVGTRFSGTKGAHFGPLSYGHTGWTGTCFWIDPEVNSFYVLMTNRNHPTEKGMVGLLRYETATLAAEAMGCVKAVKSGADVVAERGLKELEGKRIGLITNQTGLTSDGGSTLKALEKTPGAKVTVLFSPEHGIAGKLDHENIADTKDETTGLPVFSLYNKERRPSKESLKNVDALVFDIQDIGCRFYTYISTMLNCMQAASEAGIPFVVLDRVNPVDGNDVEGPLPIDVKNPFVACHTIPIRHGMTAGELAKLFAAERVKEVKLTVVPVEGWQRRLFFTQTLAPWQNPSPNMRSPEAALLYPGVGLLEFSNISVGRGTDTPFNVVGAPWINGPALLERLKKAKLSGLYIEAADFTPNASKFANELCHGVRLSVSDPRALDSVKLGIAIAQALFEEHGEKYELAKVNTLLFHPPTLEAIRAHRPLNEIVSAWKPEITTFRQRRAAALLYPETP